MNAHKKINLQLDDYLSELLGQQAHQHSVSKSKLLREWIRKQVDAGGPSPEVTEEDHTSFCFLLDQDTFAQLEKSANQKRLSKNAFLRQLILDNVNKTSTKSINTNGAYEKLWRQSEFQLLYNELAKKNELSIEEKLLLAKAKSKIGLTKESNDDLDEIESQTDDKQLLMDAKLTRIYSYYFHEQIAKSLKTLQEIGEIAAGVTNRGLIGDYYYMKGETYRQIRDFDESLRYYELSAEYYDRQEYPRELMDAYLRISRIHNQNLKNDQVTKYLNKAEDLLNEFPDKGRRGRYLSELAYNSQIAGDSNKAKSYLAAADDNYREIGAQPRIDGNLLSQIKIEMQNGNYDAASRYLRILEKARARYREEFNDGELEIMKIILDHRYSTYQEFENSVVKQGIVVEEQSRKNRYLIYSMQYARASGAVENKDLHVKFKRLADESRTELMDHAIATTLKDRSIQAIK